MIAQLVTAAAGGCLYALSNVGFGYWLLAFVYLIPLWLSIDALRLTTRKPLGRIALTGLVFGFAAFIVGYPWLLVLSERFLGSGALVGFLLWLIFGVWFACGYAIYAISYQALMLRNCPQVLAACGPLLILEWCQTSLFPSYGGAALIAEPLLAQIADIGGPLLLTAFVALVNCALYPTIKWLLIKHYNWPMRLYQSETPPFNALLAGGVLLGAVLIYGDYQQSKLLMAQAESDAKHSKHREQALTIGVIQSNLVKLDKAELSQKSHAEHLRQSREFLANTEVDLLIWPESAYVRGLRRPLPLDAQFIRGDIKVPLLFGGTSLWQKNGQRVSANSVFLADQQGKIQQAYDKSKLIPFAEYLPLKDSLQQTELMQPYQELASKLFPHAQHFDSNTEQQALQLDQFRIAAPICYEIIHPEFVRQLVKQTQANLLVTLANDSWFGDTREPWIHLSLARLRAIEHRRWLIRSTNSGISAVINPAGQIITRTELHRRENLKAVVYPSDQKTFYSEYGNWVGWLALLFSLLPLAASFSIPLVRRFSTAAKT